MATRMLHCSFVKADVRFPELHLCGLRIAGLFCNNQVDISVRDLLKSLSANYRNHCPGLTVITVRDLPKPAPVPRSASDIAHKCETSCFLAETGQYGAFFKK